MKMKSTLETSTLQSIPIRCLIDVESTSATGITTWQRIKRIIHILAKTQKGSTYTNNKGERNNSQKHNLLLFVNTNETTTNNATMETKHTYTIRNPNDCTMMIIQSFG